MNLNSEGYLIRTKEEVKFVNDFRDLKNFKKLLQVECDKNDYYIKSALDQESMWLSLRYLNTKNKEKVK